MAGIQDVQPKAIQQVNLPVIAPAVLPGPAGSGVSESLPEAFQKYSNMFNTIKDKPLIQAQRENAMQQAQLTQQNAPAIARAQQAASDLSFAQSRNAAGSLGAEDMFRLYRSVHGVDPLDANGNIDNDAIKRGAVDIHNAMWDQQQGLAGFTPVTTTSPGPNGQPMYRVTNQLGDLFYNPDGTENKVIQDYRKRYREAGIVLHTRPDKSGHTAVSTAPDPNDEEAVTPPPQPAMEPTQADNAISPGIPLANPPPVQSVNLPATPPSVEPINPQVAQTMAGIDALKQRVSGPAGPPVYNLDDLDAYRAAQGQPATVWPMATSPVTAATVAPTTTVTHDANNKPVLTITPPATPTPSAMVQPRGVAGPGEPVRPGQMDYMGRIGGILPNELNNGVAIQKQKSENPGWQTWYHSFGEANEIKSMAADPLLTNPKGDMNPFDLRLRRAVTSMLNPQTAGRGGGAEMAEIALKQPWMERYGKNIGQFLMGTGALTPQSRRALVATASQIVSTREQTGRGAVQSAIAQYQRSNLWPQNQSDFTPEELSLAQGSGGATTAAAPGGGAFGPTVKTLDGRNVRMKLPQ